MNTPTRLAARVAVTVAFGVGLLAGAAPALADPTPTPAPAPAAPTNTPNPDPENSAAPSTSPSPSAQPAVTSTGGDDPAWYDVGGQIRKGVTDLIAWVGQTGLKPVMETLGSTVLATPDLTGNERVKLAHSTFQMIANSLLVLFVVAAGYILVTRDTLQTRYGLRQLAPRFFVAAFAANTSMIICGKAIEFTNALAAAIVGPGVDGPAAAAVLQQAMFGGATGDGPNASGLVIPMLILTALVMAVVVVIVFSLRLVILTGLVAVAPLALMCHALPQAEGVARVWWKAFGAVLVIELGSAAVVLVTVRVQLAPDGMLHQGQPSATSALVSVCMTIATLWLLIKIPSWLKAFVFGPGQGRSALRSLLGTIVAIKTLGALSKSASSRPPRQSRATAGDSNTGATGNTSSAPTPIPAYAPSTPVPQAVLFDKPVPRAGPVVFSHAPDAEQPLGYRAGSASVWPDTAQPPSTVAYPAHGPVPAARFSDAPRPDSPLPGRPGPAAGPARFSDAPIPPPLAPRPSGTAAPPVAFSHAAPPAAPSPARPAAPAAPQFPARRPSHRNPPAASTRTTSHEPPR